MDSFDIFGLPQGSYVDDYSMIMKMIQNPQKS